MRRALRIHVFFSAVKGLRLYLQDEGSDQRELVGSSGEKASPQMFNIADDDDDKSADDGSTKTLTKENLDLHNAGKTERETDPEFYSIASSSSRESADKDSVYEADWKSVKDQHPEKLKSNIGSSTSSAASVKSTEEEDMETEQPKSKNWLTECCRWW